MPQDDLTRFTEAINRQGFPFQSAVLRRLRELFERKRSVWTLEATEFPVEVNSQGTRIDLLLRTVDQSYWLVGECKRVNPAYSDWLFARSEYIGRNLEERYVVEAAKRTAAPSFNAGGMSVRLLRHGHYHTGFTVKSDRPGDPTGGRDQIEEAATQVLKGVNGLVNFWQKTPTTMPSETMQFILPVIFTTANLRVTDTDLANADLESGRISQEELSVEPRSYIYYQYHLSPGLKHLFAGFHELSELASLMQSEYIRTIAIVSAAGIDDFIRDFHPKAFTISLVKLR
jgi:hypothetical protein